MLYLPADAPLTPGDLVRMARGGGAVRVSGLEWQPTALFGSGRAALAAGLRALGIGPDDEVLLPAYLCESVVSPVVEVGATPVFYPVGRDCGVDLALLDAAIGARTRAVVLIHFLGFPGPVEAVRDLCTRRGIALVEDCAHALFGRLGARPLGWFGDVAAFSPWKSLPLPDGGALVLNRPGLVAAEPSVRPSTARSAARLGYRALGTLEMAVGWSPRLALLHRASLRRGLHDATSGAPVVDEGMSAPARRMLAAITPQRAASIVARRRANYMQMHAAFAGLSWARPLFGALPDGVCPLGYPLVVEDRDHWRDVLLARGVNVRTYWEHLPAVVDPDRFLDAAWLRDRILILPIHQGLHGRQVGRIARLLASLETRS